MIMETQELDELFAAWLAEFDCTASDIEEDAKGKFVRYEEEGEIEDGGMTSWSVKAYLPKEFQNLI